MTKAKTKAPDQAPDRKDAIIAELRKQVAGLQSEVERTGEKLAASSLKALHLEKTGEALKAENDALHKSLRDAQIAKARAEGRAEVLETFAPDVMAPRSRFPRAIGGDLSLIDHSRRDRRWFEGG